jgi:hypothetical protein
MEAKEFSVASLLFEIRCRFGGLRSLGCLLWIVT